MNTPNSRRVGSNSISPKIRAWHWDRTAIVYVRQSSPQQVLNHRESKDRQYGLVQRAIDLGWSRDQVIVIDDDQGLSGSSADGRLGFQRLLAEVGLNQVGLILGLEMSRLARSCKDWYQLLELCGIFRTLLADQDGVYDPTEFNDRLLLGLKGTMSEAELHVLKGRMMAGRLNKAQRGELFSHPPIGYVRLPSGALALDPDEQVQDGVRLIFDLFDRFGTARQVFRHLVQEKIRIGVRPHIGPNRGQLEWRILSRNTVLNLLQHPIYAGGYRYRHRVIDPRKQVPNRPGVGRVMGTEDNGFILLEGRLPAYISRERFQVIQDRLAENRARSESKGSVRCGPALLGGLLVCSRCQIRMTVHYCGDSQTLRYDCRSSELQGEGPRCQALSGRTVDALVTEQVLEALKPSALAMSLAAVQDVQRERDRLTRQWNQQLERARYQADRAARQYHAAEPENRLVVRTLEKQWDDALQAVRRLEMEYEHFRRTQPAQLTPEDRHQIEALAQDLPRLWQAATTTAADRQRIIRFVVSRVLLSVDENSNRCVATIEWAGGATTTHEFLRSVRTYEEMPNFPQLLARLRELVRAGHGPTQTAAILNEEQFSATCPWQRIGDHTVLMLLRRHGPKRLLKLWSQGRIELANDEWHVADLAKRLRVGRVTIWRWVNAGWIRHRMIRGRYERVICWADREDLKRLDQLREYRKSCRPNPPAELTTPKPRPEPSVSSTKRPKS